MPQAQPPGIMLEGPSVTMTQNLVCLGPVFSGLRDSRTIWGPPVHGDRVLFPSQTFLVKGHGADERALDLFEADLSLAVIRSQGPSWLSCLAGTLQMPSDDGALQHHLKGTVVL